MKGVKKSKSAQRLMDVARKNLSWHSYSSIRRLIWDIVMGRTPIYLRGGDVLEAVERLSAQSTEEQ